MTDLERLVAIEDIRRLQSRYVSHADLKEWHALALLFMPNGTFVVRGPDGDLQKTMIGRDAIERSVTQAVGAGRALHRLYSFEIDVDFPGRAQKVFAMETGSVAVSSRQSRLMRRSAGLRRPVVQVHARARPLLRRFR